MSLSQLTMTIASKAAPAEHTFAVINPATGQPFAQCPQASRGQLDTAVKAAKQALAPWQRDAATRRKILKHCGEAILKHADELARLLTQEQGKPLAKARSEIEGAADIFSHTATYPIPIDVLQDDDEIRVEVRRKPVGVVAFITPWNYPVYLGAKIAMPLLVGNTVILKPSPFTPLSTLRMGEIIRDFFPEGVLNIIAGDDEVGAWLTQHPLINKISFTGSVQTGKKIAQIAATDLKRVTLELGGNDPAIVLADADPKKIAEKIFWGAFSNSGQICIAIKRLYVHEKIFEPLVQQLVTLANAVKVGDGLDPATTMGPLNNKQQLDIVEDLVADAKKSGAIILSGGEAVKNNSGYFYPPTLVTAIAEGTRLVDEEQFGPVLPIMSFSTEQEAIERANATPMGLGASVWSSDWQHGQQVADQLQSGTAWVNRIFDTHADAPFGGFKSSGIGREGGPWGLESFTELQTISIAKK